MFASHVYPVATASGFFQGIVDFIIFHMTLLQDRRPFSWGNRSPLATSHPSSLTPQKYSGPSLYWKRVFFHDPRRWVSVFSKDSRGYNFDFCCFPVAAPPTGGPVFCRLTVSTSFAIADFAPVGRCVLWVPRFFCGKCTAHFFSQWTSRVIRTGVRSRLNVTHHIFFIFFT